MSEYHIDNKPATYDEVWEYIRARSKITDLGGIEIWDGPEWEDFMTPEALAKQKALSEQTRQRLIEEADKARRGEGGFYDITVTLEGLPTKRKEITGLEYRSPGHEPRIGEGGVIAFEPIDKEWAQELYEGLTFDLQDSE